MPSAHIILDINAVLRSDRQFRPVSAATTYGKQTVQSTRPGKRNRGRAMECNRSRLAKWIPRMSAWYAPATDLCLTSLELALGAASRYRGCDGDQSPALPHVWEQAVTCWQWIERMLLVIAEQSLDALFEYRDRSWMATTRTA
jgi:hypothetical protein